MVEAANVIQATSHHILHSTVTVETLELLLPNKDKFFHLALVLFHSENKSDLFELETAFQKRLDQISFFKKTLVILEYFLGIVSVLPDNSGAVSFFFFSCVLFIRFLNALPNFLHESWWC